MEAIEGERDNEEGEKEYKIKWKDYEREEDRSWEPRWRLIEDLGESHVSILEVYCIVWYCIVLYCTQSRILNCTIPYSIVLYCIQSRILYLPNLIHSIVCTIGECTT